MLSVLDEIFILLFPSTNRSVEKDVTPHQATIAGTEGDALRRYPFDALVVPGSKCIPTQERRVRAALKLCIEIHRAKPNAEMPRILFTGTEAECHDFRHQWNRLARYRANLPNISTHTDGNSAKTSDHGIALRGLFEKLLKGDSPKYIHVVTNASHMHRVLASLNKLGKRAVLVPWRVQSLDRYERDEGRAYGFYEIAATTINLACAPAQFFPFMRGLFTRSGDVFNPENMPALSEKLVQLDAHRKQPAPLRKSAAQPRQSRQPYP